MELTAIEPAIVIDDGGADGAFAFGVGVGGEGAGPGDVAVTDGVEGVVAFGELSRTGVVVPREECEASGKAGHAG